jgi:nucleotide-binding universal stress UspA family protein
MMMTIQTSGHARRIVVGVDGSVPSKAALAWAIGQARLTGAAVEAVMAWEFPATYGYPVPVMDVNWEELARQVITEALDEARPAAGQVEIEYKVMEGNAAQVLVAESEDAELLVVGSRGHGGFTEALLGSVGQHSVHHARCPVVVIRDSVTGGE